MRDHVLLQAIARVNRPYEEETDDGATFIKLYDFGLDFVGIFDRLELALAFDTVQSVIENIDALNGLFATGMRATARLQAANGCAELTNGCDHRSGA